MSDLGGKPGTVRWLPDPGHSFWRICLLASLMINIGIAGALLGGVFKHRPDEGRQAVNYGQFVPRKFFFDVAPDRRKVLADVFRSRRSDFEQMRLKTGEQAEQIAAALSDPNYDSAKTNALVDGFTIGPESLGGKGGAVLKSFYGMLTAQERAILAQDIRTKLKHESK